MSARPSRAIHPSASLTADDAELSSLSSHRRAVAFSTSVSQRRPAISPASPTLLYPGPTPPDSDNISAPSLTPFDLAPARTSCKRPRASQITVNAPPYAPTLNDDHDDILNSKKAKTNEPHSDLYTSGRHSGVGITDIDDISPMHATNFSTRQIRLPISRHFSRLSLMCQVDQNRI